MKHYFTGKYRKSCFFSNRTGAIFAFLICALLSTESLFGQTKEGPQSMFCGTVSDPDDYKKAAFFGNNQLLVDNLIKEGFAIDKNYLDRLEDIQEISATRENMITRQTPLFHIPVKAWIYRENVDIGNITLAQLDQVIDRLNELFSGQSNIRFYLLCDIDEIINGDFANDGAEFYNDYINDNRVAGALNVHFVIQSGGWAGRAQFPSDNPNYACAVTTFLLAPETIGEILAHEVGHTLGLYHTHHPGRNNSHNKNEDCGNCYQESVSRTMTQGLACVSTIGQRKCEVNGDFLCDTPADPALIWEGRVPNEFYVDVNCNYNTPMGGTDNWSDSWQPNVGNIMSYSFLHCFNNFSPLQIGSMIGNIGGIGIAPVNFTVTGNSQLCINQSATYTVNTLPGVNGYTWEVPQGYTILGGQGTNAVLVQKNVSAGGTIRVRPNCGAFEATFDVMNTSSVTIEGPNVVCPNVGYSYQVPFYENATYAWSVTNGTIVDGQGTRFPYIIFDGYVGSSLSVSISMPGCTSNVQGGMGVSRYPEQQCGSMRTEVDEADEIEDLEEEEVLDGQNQESGAELTEVPQVNMRIFPNSASSSTLIECPDNILHYQLFIFNSVGENVFFNEKVQDKYELDITNLRNGIYVVYLVNEDKVYQEKLIVNK